MLFFSCLFATITLYTSTPVSQQRKPSDEYTISLLLSSGTQAQVFRDVVCVAHAMRATGFVKIRLIALEPGPIVLTDGMRVLPQEVYPPFTFPDLLIVCPGGEGTWIPPMLSFLRACLDRQVTILIVADHFPVELMDFPLQPAQRIVRCDPDAFRDCLEEAIEGGAEAVQGEPGD